jgi:hypothetical protein
MATSSKTSLWVVAGYAALAAILTTGSSLTIRPRNTRATGIAPQRHDVESLPLDEKSSADSEPADLSWWGIVKSAAMQWVGHKDARLGAALSYYSVFSIGPLILIAIAVAGLLFGLSQRSLG